MPSSFLSLCVPLKALSLCFLLKILCKQISDASQSENFINHKKWAEVTILLDPQRLEFCGGFLIQRLYVLGLEELQENIIYHFA